MKRAQRRCAPPFQRRHSRWRAIAMQPRAHCARRRTRQRPKKASVRGRKRGGGVPRCRQGSHVQHSQRARTCGVSRPVTPPGSAVAEHAPRRWRRPGANTATGHAPIAAQRNCAAHGPLLRRKWRRSTRQRVVVEGEVVHHSRIRRATRARSRAEALQHLRAEQVHSSRVGRQPASAAVTACSFSLPYPQSVVSAITK